MSSNDIVVQVEKLGKCFNLYERPYDRLKQMILPRLKALTGRSALQCYHQEFWALKDITFEVERGKTVGIIGQNGSGKSTLLQIITGTMAPTCGMVSTQGNVAALLELGSGFNPEFTGRENVFMNGSLLGLTQREIEEKFDYIAGFADIGEHLEHPVKTYSSGMMLRLAFAVQVAVESEILIIDEALAVGDARFQMKCFKRLEELKAQGTTILFVSHDTAAVRSFCDLGLVLDHGRAVFWGKAQAATIKYFALIFPEQNQDEASSNPSVDKQDTAEAIDTAHERLTVDVTKSDEQVFGVGGATLEKLEIYGLDYPNIVIGGREMSIYCQFSWDVNFVNELAKKDSLKNDIGISIALANKKGSYIFGCNGFDHGLHIDSSKDGSGAVTFTFKAPYLLEGNYFLTVAIPVGDLTHHVQLKWYDCLVQMTYLNPNKRVFGLLGIDYHMKKDN